MAKEIYLKASKTDSGPFLDAFSPLKKIKGEPMPQAVGDNVPRGGRSGEPKARTGGAASSPPGMVAPGAEGGKWALLLSFAVGFSTAGGVKSFS
jgi:hypothetical protein